jgi:hypothetical protein
LHRSCTRAGRAETGDKPDKTDGDEADDEPDASVEAEGDGADDDDVAGDGAYPISAVAIGVPESRRRTVESIGKSPG